jgi:hypothetical protein
MKFHQFDLIIIEEGFDGPLCDDKVVAEAEFTAMVSEKGLENG